MITKPAYDSQPKFEKYYKICKTNLDNYIFHKEFPEMFGNRAIRIKLIHLK